jgi:SAM-dependent methyltransferase
VWLANEVSSFNRNRKWDLFSKEMNLTPQLRTLDVGFTEGGDNPSENLIEKYYPYPEMLTALGIEPPIRFSQLYPKVTAFYYDGGTFPFDNQSFDLCWSNAVIEHVGDRTKQINFLMEIKRVAKRAFITTPNKFFPIEVHTLTLLLHFLPKKIFEKYLILIGKEWAIGDYMNLLSLSDIKSLLTEAGITEYKIIKNKLLGFTLDFVVMF